MSDAPEFRIDRAAFAADPYPDLARMRAEAPIALVPELGATLITRRDDIYTQEKRIEVFSSYQPEGLMSKLMGENMMRKDGDAHQAERRIVFPALSPRTVRDHWAPRFRDACAAVLDDLAPRGEADLVADFAIPVSGAALCAITGLENMPPRRMDAVSQAMIDGCANYAGDPDIEARCHAATAEIDAHIGERITELARAPDPSVLSVQMQAGLNETSTRANVKLVISGGQNEPRDAIAGAAWALLAHPQAAEQVRAGRASWAQAFEEYARLVAPIGMSPRRVARHDTVNGVSFAPEDRVFLMFSSANRDEAHFAEPDRYEIARDTGPALTFGAGPHFCLGAAAARCLIIDVALPMLFDRLHGLELAGEVRFHGWAFRGPVSVPVRWRA
jgi:cytochrome P450